jgi:regulatory protein
MPPGAPSPGRPRRTLKQRAIALLARREYARAELAQRLLATGAERSEVEAVLNELSAAGLLSDARFAAALVHRKARDFSRNAIAHALREKGVSANEAREALAELDGADDLARAHALWTRRFGRAPADEREKARQVRFLVSRGYSQGVAFKVLKQAGSEIDGDERSR